MDFLVYFSVANENKIIVFFISEITDIFFFLSYIVVNLYKILFVFKVIKTTDALIFFKIIFTVFTRMKSFTKGGPPASDQRSYTGYLQDYLDDFYCIN